MGIKHTGRWSEIKGKDSLWDEEVAGTVKLAKHYAVLGIALIWTG
jgi:hypothetical protein